LPGEHAGRLIAIEPYQSRRIAALTPERPFVSSVPVREGPQPAASCTGERTALARSSRRGTLDAVDRLGAALVAVEWEDITAYTRTAIPEDFEPYRLRKLTCGVLWKETDDYIVVVGDYDITNAGKDYRHNDFHIIPRGVIRQLTVLRDPSELVSLDVASAS
jgi:hypothetical protein